MDLRLTDKVAIVTGSSRGIGKAIAAGLAAEGCRVILCAWDADVLEQSAAELRRTGAKVLAVTADLSRPEDPARVIEEAVRISSIWGRETGGTATYNAVKAAEISLAKSLARELAPMNIRVNSVAPGSIFFPGGSWDRRLPQRGWGPVAVEYLRGEP
ncbi:MAG: SDR family NAD(P)-dependent oxidoreductase [candidate division NC10 bacterium]